MTEPITRHRDIESLQTAARWPGADRATKIVLAIRLAAARADAEGYRYFSELADAQPGEALPLALAGFFQARLGEEVDAALAKLDQAAATDLGPPQYFRGLALAGLPPDRRRAARAVADLEFVLAVRDQFPPMLIRAAYHGLAAAHAALGHDAQAAEAGRKSGLGAAPADTQLMFGGFWATAADGFRFTSPRILRPEPGIQVAQGYDFADLAFITTSDGVVAIDAGTTQDRVKAALGDLDLPADAAISHLILTHAHWDHIGGAGALAGPGTRVIAQAGFPAALDREQGERPQYRYFTGAAGSVPLAVVPDQLISQPTPLTAGDTEVVLYPAPGGETTDALMVHLPASGVLFAGDVLMPYLGQPFAGEGSPEGLLQALAFIGSLRPRLLIQGHTTLTELFTAEAVPGLEAALTQLHGEVLHGIRDGRTLPDILQEASLPAVLRDHPTAVVPYLVIRDHFTERLYHQRTGYWQPDGRGLEPATAAEHAAALDLLAGGRDEQFAAAAATLIAQGDHALALQIKRPPARELDFGLPISIVILLLVFAAVVAGLMPVLMALLFIIVGLGIAALLAREFSLSVFIVNMMTGMGLALGIDYSLFMISRFREERGHGRGKEAAIRMTGATASCAVLFSGSTFVVALLGMFLVPVTLLRSLAAGAVIVGVVSVAVALTLLPAMLSLIGDRVNSLPLPIVGKNPGRSDAAEARIWRAVTSMVMRRPAVSLVLAGGFMVLAAMPSGHPARLSRPRPLPP